MCHIYFYLLVILCHYHLFEKVYGRLTVFIGGNLKPCIVMHNIGEFGIGILYNFRELIDIFGIGTLYVQAYGIVQTLNVVFQLSPAIVGYAQLSQLKNKLGFRKIRNIFFLMIWEKLKIKQKI